MSVIEIISGILLLVSCVVIIFTIMLQESKQANGLNALDGGASETYVSRYGAKTKEKFYAKLTKILAVIFFVVSLIVDLVINFSKVGFPSVRHYSSK